MQNELNPKLYKDNKLKSDVRQAILDIVNEFKEFLEIPINILDVRIVGSNAAYNYKDDSDLDIHLVVDTISNINCKYFINILEIIKLVLTFYKLCYII